MKQLIYLNYDDEKDRPAILFRYMDNEKLNDFLSSSSIYFCRMDRFGDKLEGITPYQMIELMGLYEYRFPGSVTNHNFTEIEKKEIYNSNETSFQVTKAEIKQNQKTIFVSCWYCQNHESQAMWDIYGKEGVAIRMDRNELNTILENSLTDSDGKSFAGFVDYKNFKDVFNDSNEELWSKSNPFFRKHISFNHEDEYRFALHRPGLIDNEGIKIKTAILESESLEIIISPKMDHDNFERKKAEILENNPDIKVRKSDLTMWNLLK
ncbi:DUF2971 domain-containing protein [bacterium]|nr:DUF2971 domain-containing protein [bacterium]